MSELKYNQIVDKLNTEFASEGRRLVFWYDDNGYFADDVDAMPLQNAKIWHLTPTNQFRTKILLEREDPQSNYLIYAPFPKPPVEQNHLEDTILYSKQFHADPISLLCSDLGIGAEGKAVLQKYAKVVGEQTRKQRFCDYKLAAYTADAVETALLCTVCKCRTAQFEDALREILLADTPDANPKLDELAKYKLDEVFWKHCETELGFAVPAPNVDKLKISLFVTSLAHSVKVIPDAWQPFAAAKPGSVLAFMDGMMNNVNYGDAFDAMAAAVQDTLHAKAALAKLPHDLLTDCECLPCVDELLTGWMTERLQAEDVTAALNGESIPELCQRRAKTHFAASWRCSMPCWKARGISSALPTTAPRQIMSTSGRSITAKITKLTRSTVRFTRPTTSWTSQPPTTNCRDWLRISTTRNIWQKSSLRGIRISRRSPAWAEWRCSGTFSRNVWPATRSAPW